MIKMGSVDQLAELFILCIVGTIIIAVVSVVVLVFIHPIAGIIVGIVLFVLLVYLARDVMKNKS